MTCRIFAPEMLPCAWKPGNEAGEISSRKHAGHLHEAQDK